MQLLRPKSAPQVLGLSDEEGPDEVGGHVGDLGGLAYSPAYTHICITVFANLVWVLGDVGVAGGSGPVGAGP